MKKAAFHALDRAAWPRSEHFDYYVKTIKCRYDITVDLDVSRLLPTLRARRIRRYPALLYIAARAVNRNREFRMGFDADGAPGYWDFVHPSYTIFHADDKTFSDIWSEYDEAFHVFYANVTGDMERCRDVRGVCAKAGRPPNACPISLLPWLRFTGLARVQAADPPFLTPLITFGRHFRQGAAQLLPLSVSVHHAAADGYHASRLINDMQAVAHAAEQWARI